MVAGAGRLVLVGTPIGNLGDLSPRAADALRTADVVCCEDTRHTRKLLSAADIQVAGLVPLHEHNEAGRVRNVLDWLAAGRTVVLVSDAGMPAISDPGSLVVEAAAAAGHVVEVVPGPSAVVAALAISGLSTQRFAFEGFLPRKGGDRTRRLAEVAVERRTVVLYEAPHRLLETLADLAAVCGGDRRVSLCRELTKLHEEVWRGTLAKAAALAPRGEYVVVLEGAPAPVAATDDELRRLLAAHLAAGDTKRDAVAGVVDATGEPKRRVFALSLDVAAQRAGPGDVPPPTT